MRIHILKPNDGLAVAKSAANWRKRAKALTRKGEHKRALTCLSMAFRFERAIRELADRIIRGQI